MVLVLSDNVTCIYCILGILQSQAHQETTLVTATVTHIISLENTVRHSSKNQNRNSDCCFAKKTQEKQLTMKILNQKQHKTFWHMITINNCYSIQLLNNQPRWGFMLSYACEVTH